MRSTSGQAMVRRRRQAGCRVSPTGRWCPTRPGQRSSRRSRAQPARGAHRERARLRDRQQLQPILQALAGPRTTGLARGGQTTSPCRQGGSAVELRRLALRRAAAGSGQRHCRGDRIAGTASPVRRLRRQVTRSGDLLDLPRRRPRADRRHGPSRPHSDPSRCARTLERMPQQRSRGTMVRPGTAVPEPDRGGTNHGRANGAVPRRHLRVGGGQVTGLPASIPGASTAIL